MKRIIIYILFFSLVSCNKNETTNHTKDNQIRFFSFVENYTKALTTYGPIDLNKLRLSNDGFVVCTKGLDSEMDKLVIKYSGGAWKYTGDYYWPDNVNKKVSFTAYAPAGAGDLYFSKNGLNVNNFIQTADLDKQIDYIYAPPADYSYNTSGYGVMLTFKHLLTQVLFSITTDIPAKYNPKVLSLKLNLPKARGSYNGIKWSTSVFSRDYIVYNGNPLSGTPAVSLPLLLVPQSALSSPTMITISIMANNVTTEITRDLSQLTSVIEWKIGFKVIYNIVIRKSTMGLTSLPDEDIEAIEIFGFDQECNLPD